MEENNNYYNINLNDTTSLPLFQNFIRHYIGDKQYTDTYFLEVYDNNNNCINRIINDELKLFMAGKEEIQHSSPDEHYKVLIGYDYEYNFEYNNKIITVILRIFKQKNKIKISNIKSQLWNDTTEKCFVYSNNVDFINELYYVFALKTPNLEHYHKNNERITDRIMLLQHEKDATKLMKDYYVDYPVYQLSKDNVAKLNDLNYIASIKIDGIRTFVVITKNKIICYQKYVSFEYIHNMNITGNYIFDCELCNGELFLIDCFMYNNIDMKEIIFSERINCMKEFANNYPIFNNQEHITINVNILNDYINNNDISRFKKYFENPDFFNSINSLKQLVLNTTFNYNKSQYLTQLNILYNKINQNQNFNNKDLLLSYIKTLINYINKIQTEYFKNAYEQCIKIIRNNYINMYMILYSPIVLITLLSYYYKIGYYDNESVYKKYAYQIVNDMNQSKIILPHNSLIDLEESYKNCTYPNDGIIFTENSHMKPGMYIKWKPRDKLSADLKIILSDDITVNNSENYMLGSLNCLKNNKDFTYVSHNFLLNNFNKTLPMCENKDIVQSNNIVEVVPISKGNKQYDYKLLKVRYDKEKPNSITTVKEIFNQIDNYINLF